MAITILYIIIGSDVSAVTSSESVDWVKILPYLTVIVLAIAGMNVVTVLALGIALNGVIGWITGSYSFVGWLSAIGSGIGGMGELIIVSLLAGGLLELIRYNGGLEFVIRLLTRRISTRRGAAFSIAGLISLVNMCTANNTIAIITVGPLAKDISGRFGLDPRKTASLLDVFSCLVQGILPYGAQMLMACGLAGISALSIIGRLYYPFALGIMAIAAILFDFPRLKNEIHE